jgi:hypothetical protein
MRTIKIWCSSYRPFICGGDVNQPLATKMSAEGPMDLGKGVKAYLVKAANGKQYVVDAASHGIVGDSLEQVRKDVAKADIKVIRRQIKEAKERGKTAKFVTAEKFWEGWA